MPGFGAPESRETDPLTTGALGAFRIHNGHSITSAGNVGGGRGGRAALGFNYQRWGRTALPEQDVKRDGLAHFSADKQNTGAPRSKEMLSNLTNKRMSCTMVAFFRAKGNSG
jgi:hypothetical protein